MFAEYDFPRNCAADRHGSLHGWDVGICHAAHLKAGLPAL
jgi:hypothetical protein